MGNGDSAKKMADKIKDKAAGEDQGQGQGQDIVDAVGDKIDQLTGGKYAEQVDKGQDKAREQMRRMKGDRS